MLPALLLYLAPRTHLLRALIGISAASFLLNVSGAAGPWSTFYLLPTRAWQPLLGACWALFRRSSNKPPRTAPIIGWIGLAAVLAGCLLLGAEQDYPGWAGLVPALGTLAMLAAVEDERSALAKLFAHPALVWIGQASYSLYLWHWPALVIGRQRADLVGESRLGGGMIGLAIGLLLAVIAFHGVETPLRVRGPGRRRRLAIIALLFASTVAWCFYISKHNVVSDPDDLFDPVEFESPRYGTGELAMNGVRSTSFADVEMPPQPAANVGAWRTGGVVHAWGRGAPRVVVLGSSHGLMYADVIDDVCRAVSLPVAFLCADGVPAIFDGETNPNFPTATRAREFDDTRRRLLAEWRPQAVVVVERWDRFGSTLPASLERLFAAIDPCGARTILVAQVPKLSVGDSLNLREYVTFHARRTGRPPPIPAAPDDRTRRLANELLEAAARSHPRASVLRPDALFEAKDDTIRYAQGRRFFYTDDDHLSQAGAYECRPLFLEALSPK